MHPAVATHLEGIAAICRQHRIRRLELFGSAAREGDFAVDRSDVDFLLEFEPDAKPDLETYFSAKTAFEALLGREVDLLERGALRDPFVLREIERGRETVYAA